MSEEKALRIIIVFWKIDSQEIVKLDKRVFYESVLSSSINMSECNGKKRTRKSDWKQKLRELKEFQYELNDRNREDVDGPKRVNGFIIIELGTIHSSPPSPASVSSSSLSLAVSTVSTEHCIQ